jgi:hypothetical protein
MLIYQETFDSVESTSYVLTKLNTAIGTTYIPAGRSVEELVQCFMATQLDRRFTGSGFGSAFLEMKFGEKDLIIKYHSTSGTGVDVKIDFDDDMEVSSCMVKVELPDDRAMPGRGHYEMITREICDPGIWIEDGKLREDPWAPVPEWVHDRMETRSWTKEEGDRRLEAVGFVPTKIPGFWYAWTDDQKQTFVVCKRQLEAPMFAIVADDDDRPPEYWQEWRQFIAGMVSKIAREKKKQERILEADGDEEYDDEEYEDFPEDLED